MQCRSVLYFGHCSCLCRSLSLVNQDWCSSIWIYFDLIFRHPFSLTSGPQDDYLSVHIRTLGDWSYQIYALFQEVQKIHFLMQNYASQISPVSKLFLNLQAVISGTEGCPKLYIDGPYGSPSQDHVKYDIVVLIGLGIGATPFISILKDVANGVQTAQSDHVSFFFFLCYLFFFAVIIPLLKFNFSSDPMKQMPYLAFEIEWSQRV